MKNKITFLIFLMQLICFSPAFAERDEMADPLRINIGAKYLGRGRAYAAQTQDVRGVYTNPAALNGLSGIQMTSFYTTLVSAYEYRSLAAACQVNDWVLGLGYYGWSVDDIPRTDVNTATGRISQIGGFTGGDRSYIFSFAHPLTIPLSQKIYAGGAVKMKEQYIDNDSRTGFGMNVGVIMPEFMNNPRIDIGLSVSNFLKAPMKWSSGERDVEESRFRAGLTYRASDPWKVYCDVENSSFFKVYAGTEYDFENGCSLRGGIAAEAFTLGIGVEVGNLIGMDYAPINMTFDYALEYNTARAPLGNEAYTHYFSISISGQGGSDKPILNEPKNLVEVKGEYYQMTGKAPAGSQVMIYKQDMLIKTVPADQEGYWEMWVPLSSAITSVYARAQESGKRISDPTRKLIIRKK